MTEAAPSATATYREIAPDRRDEAIAKGYKRRHFFPHRTYYLPKCGPDGFKLAQWMCGTTAPSACWEIVLYALPPVVDEFPPSLFFDDDLLWHQQHFGRLGQVAAVDLAVERDGLYTMAHQSDLVQRISRRRELKTLVEKRFEGWHHLLLNSIANFAVERGIKRIYSPTSEFAMRHTDRTRNVKPELFERLYDRDIHRRYRAERIGDRWWAIDVASIGDQLLKPTLGREPIADEKRICVYHDIERGIGHAVIDPEFASLADRTSPRHLEAMLEIERRAGVRTSYNVVGALLSDVRAAIERDGHCIAFHSYDHARERLFGGRQRQLAQCRQVDYRIKGYRPAQNKLTAELTDENLCTHNFEWIAASPRQLAVQAPELRDRIVRIPLWSDDFYLHSGRMKYEQWERRILALIERCRFTTLGLHDCYAAHWLPHYERLLDRIQSLATVRTLDSVAFDAILGSAE